MGVCNLITLVGSHEFQAKMDTPPKEGPPWSLCPFSPLSVQVQCIQESAGYTRKSWHSLASVLFAKEGILIEDGLGVDATLNHAYNQVMTGASVGPPDSQSWLVIH